MLGKRNRNGKAGLKVDFVEIKGNRICATGFDVSTQRSRHGKVHRTRHVHGLSL